jgi:hypothetical protein
MNVALGLQCPALKAPRDAGNRDAVPSQCPKLRFLLRNETGSGVD